MKKTFSGFTLIEILVAIAIGIILTGFIISIFASNKASYKRNNSSIEVSANIRHALSLIREDLFNVGFYGGLTRENDIGVNFTNITNTYCTGEIPDDAGGVISVNYATDTNYPIIGYEAGKGDYLVNKGGGDCTENITSGTDFIAIKGVRGTPVATADLNDDANVDLHPYVYIRSGKTEGEFTATDLGSNISNSTDMNWQYYSRIYYVRSNRLLMREFVYDDTNARSWWNEPEILIGPEFGGDPDLCEDAENHLLSGVETLQFMYGIDTDRPQDGTPNYYTGVPNSVEMQNLIEVKIYLLVRSRINFDYEDKNIYLENNDRAGIDSPIGNADSGSYIDFSGGGIDIPTSILSASKKKKESADDPYDVCLKSNKLNFRRKLVTSTVVIRNQWYSLLRDPSSL